MGSQGHPVPPHPSALPKPVGMRGRPQRVCPHVTDPEVVIGSVHMYDRARAGGLAVPVICASTGVPGPVGPRAFAG